MSSPACPSRLRTGAVTSATPAVPAIAPRSDVSAAAPPDGGSLAATISGASNPGPNPCAMVA
jgi:hypothetical protein